MGVLLYGVTNIEWFAGFDMFEMLAHIKCDSIHDIFRFAIHQFQFHVFVLFSNKAACSVIGYTPVQKIGFWFPAERIKLFQHSKEIGRDFIEIDFCIYVDLRFHLVW